MSGSVYDCVKTKEMTALVSVVCVCVFEVYVYLLVVVKHIHTLLLPV